MSVKFWSPNLLAVFSWLMVPCLAAEPDASKTELDQVESFEMFQAISEGKLEVNFYPKDATQATLVFKNKTDQPIDLELPKAFGAVHVLGQMGGYGGGMGGMGGGMGMGGMGGMGMGGMGGGMGGMFRVEPDKSRKMKVPCVCLEHGKKDPNPRMKYKIVPIEQVNNDPRIAKLCELLGNRKMPQNTAQAAAWHLASGLSWQELSLKNRVESKYTGNVRFFNGYELQNAFRLTAMINRQYERFLESSESTGYEENSSVNSEG